MVLPTVKVGLPTSVNLIEKKQKNAKVMLNPTKLPVKVNCPRPQC